MPQDQFVSSQFSVRTRSRKGSSPVSFENWELRTFLQRVQIRQQVLDLLVGHDLAEAFHLRSAILDDVGHTLVVCRQSAYGQVLMLKDAFQAGTFLPARRIRLMAAIAIVVVEFSALGLLRVEAEFGIGLAALGIASGKR